MLNAMLKESSRRAETDKWVNSNLEDSKLCNVVFLRLIAKDKMFTNVDFSFSFFDNCYMRNCKFEGCNFTGTKFKECNLNNSRFNNCKFEYAVFDKTFVEPDILDMNCPGHENLKLRFARTLRINYQQLGDARSANKAISVELAASEEHLKKAAFGNDRYYRDKYRGANRALAVWHFFEFKFFDYVWGNGENFIKLIRFLALMMLVILLSELCCFRTITSIPDILSTLYDVPAIFLGVKVGLDRPSLYVSSIALTRLLLMGLFLSVIIRRFSRR